MTYANTQLLIANEWRDATGGKTLPVVNPSTSLEIGRVAHASIADLDLALAAAQKGFNTWRAMSAVDRSKTMRQAAVLMRERADAIAQLMTQEQGKPLAEAMVDSLAPLKREWVISLSLRQYHSELARLCSTALSRRRYLRMFPAGNRF